MSRKSFWLGLLVGMIIMGLLAAMAGFVIVRARWAVPYAGTPRARPFGWNPRGWLPQSPRGWGLVPRLSGRSFGLRALLCVPGVLLIVGGLVVLALVGRRWWSRSGRARKRSEEPVSTAVEARPADAEPLAEANPGGTGAL